MKSLRRFWPPIRRTAFAAKRLALPRSEEAMKEWIAGGPAASRASLRDRERRFHPLQGLLFRQLVSVAALAGLRREASGRPREGRRLQADHHARLACWISDRSPMCKHITAPSDGVACLKAGDSRRKSKPQASDHDRNRSHRRANSKATHVIRWRC